MKCSSKIIRGFLTISVCISSLCLTGCQSTYYGVKEDVWNTLSDEQKDDTIRAYNRVKVLDAERKLEEAKLEQQRSHGRAWLAENRAEQVRVRILNGTLHFRGTRYELNNTEATVTYGGTSSLKMNALPAKPSLPNIEIHYTDGFIILGNMGTELSNSLRFGYESAWHDGQIYSDQHLTGQHQLYGEITVEIKALSEESDDVIETYKILKKSF